MTDTLRTAHEHCQQLQDALTHFRSRSLEQVVDWGRHLAAVLPVGGRLLAAGNGGSAAQAQHLTAELVGRYLGERPAYSAIALHAESSSVTAIGNDYGYDEVFARQVAAHGRPGDVLVLLSTSGRSANLLRAADTGRSAGLRTWALTGPTPNPLANATDEVLSVASHSGAAVQETHLLALHLLCETFDAVSQAPSSVAATATSTSGAASGPPLSPQPGMT